MPSRPPPPEPYETWLDYLISSPWSVSTIKAITLNCAAAELAELRAELERLRAFYDSVTATKSATVPPSSTTYTIFGAGDTTGRNPCDPADEYLRNARKA